MKTLFDHSFFKPNKTDKAFISSSLKNFSLSPLSQISKEDLQSAKKIWNKIQKKSSKLFIFAFGGANSTTKMTRPFFSSKNKPIFLVDKQSDLFLNHLKSLKKSELTDSHFLFISKSGQTKEILFYKSLIEKIHSQKTLPLSENITVLTGNSNSPLLKWAKKKKVQICFLESPLPGRFSFFNLSGLLQLEAQGGNINRSWKFPATSDSEIQALEFFIHQYKTKKEIILCPLNSQLKEMALWTELLWSESLFKSTNSQPIPLLRNRDFHDLIHAGIEELICKGKQSCFWALDIKDNKNPYSQYVPKIKNLLKQQKISYMFTQFSLTDGKSFIPALAFFYKILFCAGSFSKLDIYTQNWVNYLKRM